MAREHVIRLYAPPPHTLSSSLRPSVPRTCTIAQHYIFDILLFCGVLELREVQIAAHGSRTSDLPWGVMKFSQKVRLSLSTAAQLRNANPWPPPSGSRSEENGGSTECKFLGRLLRRHGQPAAELVPCLARGRTVHGCMWVSSNGECWKITTQRADLDEHPASGLESQKEKKKT